MFKLKAAFAMFMVCAAGSFGVMLFYNRVPYSAVNLLFLLASPAGYIYSDRVSYALAALSWIACYPLFTFVYRIDPLNAAMPILIFNGLLLVCLAYQKIMRRERSLYNRRLKDRKSRLSSARERLGQAQRIEGDIKSSETALISLYEITKKMSESLKFDDIFRTFSLFLKENFTFRRCILLVMGHGASEARSDKEYIVWKDRDGFDSGAPSPEQDKPDLGRLMKVFADGARDIYLSRKEDAQTLNELGVAGRDVETFVAIPLPSEKRTVGILAIENLPKTDTERFVILAMQLALEMEKVLLYELVEKMAITDSLTGLYVRRHFYERLTEELTRSKRYKFKFAALLLDIDDFKKCNDTFGHLVGDAVLKEMARVVRENVREIDIVGRYGGEEISLVLPETGEDNAKIVAERLRSKIAEHEFKAYDERLKITVSVGVSTYPKDASDMKSIVDKSDLALYAAKKSGKNVVCVYKKEYNTSL